MNADPTRYAVVGHRGGLPDFVSLLMLVPQRRCGVVVLADGDHGKSLAPFGKRLLSSLPS